MEVVWSPKALTDIERIFDYLVELNPHAAGKVFDALIKTGDGLADFPSLGRLVRGEIRELTVSYPYIIRYRVASDAIRILRIRHTARRPL